MDIYQGSIGTISPAMGNYDLQVYVNVDKKGAGVPGMGETGTGTLEPVKWDIGVTGIQFSNFTNFKPTRY
jgi:hypothetical protein